MKVLAIIFISVLFITVIVSHPGRRDSDDDSCSDDDDGGLKINLNIFFLE